MLISVCGFSQEPSSVANILSSGKNSKFVSPITTDSFLIFCPINPSLVYLRTISLKIYPGAYTSTSHFILKMTIIGQLLSFGAMKLCEYSKEMSLVILQPQ